MKKIILITILLLSNLLCYGKEEVKNPVKHFIETHTLDKDSKIKFFEVDFNSDKKPDIFVSATDSDFHNGQLGYIYLLYINKGNHYFLDRRNCITIHYDKMIFNDNSYFKYHVPFIIIEEHAVWGCSYENDRIKEFKLCDLTWGKYPHSPDIFHAILEHDTKKIHPLIEVKLDKAEKKWHDYKTSK